MRTILILCILAAALIAGLIAAALSTSPEQPHMIRNPHVSR